MMIFNAVLPVWILMIPNMKTDKITKTEIKNIKAKKLLLFIFNVISININIKAIILLFKFIFIFNI